MIENCLKKFQKKTDFQTESVSKSPAAYRPPDAGLVLVVQFHSSPQLVVQDRQRSLVQGLGVDHVQLAVNQPTIPRWKIVD
jgi:hypothetical protein